MKKGLAYSWCIRVHQRAHEAQEYATMVHSTDELRVVPLPGAADALTEVLRAGAQKLLVQAIEAEVADWFDHHQHCVDDHGHRQVVHNGHLPARSITTGVGPVEVRQPRVRDRRPAHQA
jgi:hypothetical protein